MIFIRLGPQPNLIKIIQWEAFLSRIQGKPMYKVQSKEEKFRIAWYLGDIL